MLYVFAGLKRKNSVADYLRKKAAKFHVQVEIHEVDIQRSRRMDLTSPRVQKRHLQAIDSGVYDAVILTPPCSTFSRAVWANDRGPYRAMDASRLFGGWLCAPVFACVGCVFLLYFVVRGNTK